MLRDEPKELCLLTTLGSPLVARKSETWSKWNEAGRAEYSPLCTIHQNPIEISTKPDPGPAVHTQTSFSPSPVADEEGQVTPPCPVSSLFFSSLQSCSVVDGLRSRLLRIRNSVYIRLKWRKALQAELEIVPSDFLYPPFNFLFFFLNIVDAGQLISCILFISYSWNQEPRDSSLFSRGEANSARLKKSTGKINSNTAHTTSIAPQFGRWMNTEQINFISRAIRQSFWRKIATIY